MELDDLLQDYFQSIAALNKEFVEESHKKRFFRLNRRMIEKCSSNDFLENGNFQILFSSIREGLENEFLSKPSHNAYITASYSMMNLTMLRNEIRLESSTFEIKKFYEFIVENRNDFIQFDHRFIYLIFYELIFFAIYSKKSLEYFKFFMNFLEGISGNNKSTQYPNDELKLVDMTNLSSLFMYELNLYLCNLDEIEGIDEIEISGLILLFIDHANYFMNMMKMKNVYLTKYDTFDYQLFSVTAANLAFVGYRTNLNNEKLLKLIFLSENFMDVSMKSTITLNHLEENNSKSDSIGDYIRDEEWNEENNLLLKYVYSLIMKDSSNIQITIGSTTTTSNLNVNQTGEIDRIEDLLDPVTENNRNDEGTDYFDNDDTSMSTTNTTMNQNNPPVILAENEHLEENENDYYDEGGKTDYSQYRQTNFNTENTHRLIFQSDKTLMKSLVHLMKYIIQFNPLAYQCGVLELNHNRQLRLEKSLDHSSKDSKKNNDKNQNCILNRKKPPNLRNNEKLLNYLLMKENRIVTIKNERFLLDLNDSYAKDCYIEKLRKMNLILSPNDLPNRRLEQIIKLNDNKSDNMILSHERCKMEENENKYFRRLNMGQFLTETWLSRSIILRQIHRLFNIKNTIDDAKKNFEKFLDHYNNNDLPPIYIEIVIELFLEFSLMRISIMYKRIKWSNILKLFSFEVINIREDRLLSTLHRLKDMQKLNYKHQFDIVEFF
ncbi:hypothetical protein SNEBB_006840 [Seison nebaliae]|nr:hypothetical protein SNEBB_006840 [Seison nebaliae]